MPAVIDLMRRAFREHADAAAELPDRSLFRLPASGGTVLVMPGALPRLQAVGVKVVSVFPGNPARHGLPVITATVFVVDPDTGEVALSLDGTWVTAMRTGAVTGVATDLLARQDAARLLVFGTGPQARTQIQAVCAVRSIERITICATSAAKADAFIATHRDVAPACVWQRGTGDASDVAGADLIVTATSSAVPVFDGAWLRPGTHVAAIGAFTPTTRELDTVTVTRGRLFVDDREHAWREAGDLRLPHEEGLLSPADIQGDLAALVTGRCAGRRADDEITIFKSVGLAIEDVVVGGWVREALQPEA